MNIACELQNQLSSSSVYATHHKPATTLGFSEKVHLAFPDTFKIRIERGWLGITQSHVSLNLSSISSISLHGKILTKQLLILLFRTSKPLSELQIPSKWILFICKEMTNWTLGLCFGCHFQEIWLIKACLKEESVTLSQEKTLAKLWQHSPNIKPPSKDSTFSL